MMLDYGNLSFISAQSPYVALLRSGQARARAAAARDAVEFYVYGWSRRRSLHVGTDAPPLAEAAFRQAFASRDAVLGHHHAGTESLTPTS